MGTSIGKLIRQHNVITEARYDMSALEKNILYLTMSQMKETDDSEEEYSFTLSALQSRVPSVTPKALLKATGNLVMRQYRLVFPNGDVAVFSLVSVASYCEETSELKIKIAEGVRPFLLSLRESYTEFGLDTALSLKSKYSKRIYEMISQHKDMGELQVSIEDLKLRLGLLDDKKKVEKLAGWTSFETTVLKTAQKEVSEKTDLGFTYEVLREKGSGKKYRKIRIKIFSNPKQLSMF